MSVGELQLPGGLHANRRLYREVHFAEVTGCLERQWSDSSDTLSRPAWVSRVLGVALDTVGDQSVDEETADALCVGDRKYLMLHLASRLEGDDLWLFPRCQACGEPFDVGLQRSALPVVEAGEGFPWVKVQVDERALKVRVPNGADQRHIAESDAHGLDRLLLQRCIVEVDGAPPPPGFVQTLTEVGIQSIDTALEQTAPDVGTRLEGECPACHKTQLIEVDPYDLGSLDDTGLDEDVHRLAFYYHWSEAEILDLPRDRRRRYLALIDRERGRHG